MTDSRWLYRLLTLLCLAGCAGPSAPPQQQQGPVEVTVAQPLVIQSLDWDSYTGRLAPIESVEVRARVNGYLKSHHFEEGQLVEKGQLLFVIDPRPYEASLAQAKASREEAVAISRQTEAQIAAAEARKQQVAARLQLALAQLRRAKPLVPSGAISQDEYDEYLSEARQAEADGFAADAEIESAKAALSAAQAAVVTAEAARDAAELDLSYCRITAPITGKISRRMVTEGNLITGNSFGVPLTTIISFNPIHANFDFNEQALLGYIRLDQANKRDKSQRGELPVYMALADEEGHPHRGYINFFDNRVDQTTGSMRARAIFPNDDGLFVPGVFVRIRLPGSLPGERVHLPEYAVATDQSSKIVFVVGEGGKIETRPIKVGRRSKGLIVVTEGLDGSEWVVVRGLQRCQPGVEVKTTQEVIEPLFEDGLPNQLELVPPSEFLESEQTAGASE
ncbi:Multidrug efflux pump subunit AcrA precursor [Planctomycetes bacterium MalM25]|nr:Multidrug efflux pump subunit AcrA precursor [Planctomycetes bacterium MalM25]